MPTLHTLASRVLLPLLLLVLVAAGCQRPQPTLSVTPTLRAVDLAGDRSATFQVANTGMSGSRLRWSFDSVTLEASPASGTLTAGASQAVVVTVPDDVSGSRFVGTFVAGTQSVSVTLRSLDLLQCDPESAYAGAASTEGQILVAYRAAHRPSEIARASAAAPALAIVQSAGGRLLRQGVGGEHDLLELPAERVTAVLAALRARPEVAFAIPNLPVYRSSAPNDPLYARQWNLSLFGAEPTWAAADALAAPPQVVIAVVDDGVAVDHPDLAPIVLPGWDVHDDDGDVRNCTDHGTHVAGIATAVRDDGIGVAGVASVPWVRLLPVKAWPDTTDDRAGTSISAVLRGMRWAAGFPIAGAPSNPNPADVLNLSLGTPDASTATAFATVITELEAAGIVVVSAAGNTGSSAGVDYPARAGGIAVGSVDADYTRSNFSNYGTGLSLMAPGGFKPATGCSAITSTGVAYADGIATHTWTCKAGTSMATPYVTGAVALLIGLEPALKGDPAAIETRLTDAAAQLRPPGYSTTEYGAGVLCLDALTTTTSVCGVAVDP